MAQRRNVLFTLFLVLAGAAPACLAAQYALANGGIRFTVPDGWSRILQSPGDPEMQVFQDPDPMARSKDALARVSVISQSVPDIISFRALVEQENNRARSLPHYQLDKQRSSATHFYYTATDGSVEQTYEVHYSLHDGYAVEVRCVRPTRTGAGTDWIRDFDKGCATIAGSLH